MRDFKQQLKQYGDERKKARCPYSEAELDKEIRRAIWSNRRGASPCPSKDTKATVKRFLWPTTAAAACLLAVLLPWGLRANNNDGVESVTIDGEHAYFACNNSCSASSTIETFKTLLR